MLKVAKKYLLGYRQENESQILSLIKNGYDFELIEDQEEEKEFSGDQENLQEVNYKISSLDFTIKRLSAFTQKVSFWEKFKDPYISLVTSDVQKEIQGAENIVKEVVDIEENLKKDSKEKESCLEKQQELEQFGELDFLPREGIYTDNVIVRVKKKIEPRLSAFAHKNKISTRRLKDSPGEVVVLMVFLKDKQQEVESYIKEIGGEFISYDFDKTPKEKKKELQERIEKILASMEELENRLQELSDSLRKLKIYYDFLQMKRNELEVKEKSREGKVLNYIMFWAEDREKEKFEKELKKKCSEAQLIELTPETQENPPVFLKNSKAIKPFQEVTEIFGLPQKDEIDPTPYLSLFFFVFFGICITDAGYGFLMILMTGGAFFLLRKTLKEINFVRLLIYGGISTFLAGLVFGGYFGVDASEMGVPLLKNLKALDPIEDPVIFMGFTFVLGYIQVAFSQLVKVIKARKNKQKEEIWQGAAWFLFYVFAALWILSLKWIPSLETLGLIGMGIFGLGLFVVESQGVNIFLRPLVGAIKILQGVINTVSDVLSYSRLMALGLATAVIALIINQIASLFGGMVPYVGWLITALIMIGGHLFNLAINALSGFIHSGRLQYVEFFPKFLEGGGRRMKSINPELKYTEMN